MLRPLVVNSDIFLDHAWEYGWLDERFGDDPDQDPDPQQLLDNLLLAGVASISGADILDENGAPVPGTEATSQ